MQNSRRALTVLSLFAVAISVVFVRAPLAIAAGTDFTLVPQNVTPDGNGLIKDMSIEVRGGQVSASESGSGEWLGQKGPSTARITGTYDPATGMFEATYTGGHKNTREAGDIAQDISVSFTGTASQKLDLASETVQISFAGPLTTEVTEGPSQPPPTTKDYTISVVYAVEGAGAAPGAGAAGASGVQGDPGAKSGGAAMKPGTEPTTSGGFPIGWVLAGLAVVGVIAAAVIAAAVVLVVKNVPGASTSAAAGTADAPAPADAVAPVPQPEVSAVVAEPAVDPDEEEQSEEGEKVILQLTYPVGRSPKVFTTGWVFGAKCVLISADGEETDFSDGVEWSGSGDFYPQTGARSRPAFAGEGANSISLSCDVGGRTLSRTYPVAAVSPAGYAARGTWSECRADTHGCPGCPHITHGQVGSASDLVHVDGRPAARQGDSGRAVPCCGPGTFVIAEGDPEVLIEGRPAARIGDRTDHCGGAGYLVSEVSEIALSEWGYLSSELSPRWDKDAYDAAASAAREAARRGDLIPPS